MRRIADVIRRQLSLANGKPPPDDQIGAWSRDLLSRLGPVIPEQLETAFIAAREEAAERRGRGAYGVLALDDVIRIYRNTPREASAVPYDPYCPYCKDGHVLMLDRKRYCIQVPCSCAAGRHQRETLKIYEGARNVEELLRIGWTLKSSPQRFSKEELAWVMTRAEKSSPMQALAELRALQSSGGPLPELTPEEAGRVGAVLSEKEATEPGLR